jgi:hypothetical protein
VIDGFLDMLWQQNLQEYVLESSTSGAYLSEVENVKQVIAKKIF